MISEISLHPDHSVSTSCEKKLLIVNTTLYGIVGVMQSTTKQFTHQSVIAKRFGVLTVFGA